MGASIEPSEDTQIEEPPFEVWEQNWSSLLAFLACETQWDFVGTMQGAFRRGLNYPAVEIVLRRLKLDDGVFWDLQTMESAALDAFGEIANG